VLILLPNTFADACSNWNAALDRESRWTAQRIGRFMLWVGGIAMFAGILLTPPFVNIGLGVAIAGALLSRPPLHRLGPAWVGVVFSLWIVISVLLAILRGQPGAALSGTTYGWLSMPLVAVAASDRRWRTWAIRIIIVVATAAAILACLQFTIGFGKKLAGVAANDPRMHRGNGFNNINLAYGFANAILAVILFQPAKQWNVSSTWIWIGRAASCIGLITCSSRGAHAGLIAGFTSVFAARGRRWLLAACAVVVLGSALFLGRMAMLDTLRFDNMAKGKEPRLPIWQTSLTLVSEYPLTGLGGRTAYKQAYNETFDRACPGQVNQYAKTGGAPHAHSWFIALAAEYGILAPCIHLALVLSVLHFSWRRRAFSPLCWQITCGIATIGVVSGLFEPFPTQSVPGLGFHAFLGFCIGLAITGAEQPSETTPGTSPHRAEP